MKFKTQIVIALISFSFGKVYSQTEQKQYIKSDDTLSIGMTNTEYKFIREGGNLEQLFNTIFSFNSDKGEIKTLFKEFYDENKGLASGCAVVLVRYAHSKTDLHKPLYSKLNTTVIAKSKGEYSSYILNDSRILLVFLDSTVYAEDIKITNQPSYFTTSFNDALKIVRRALLAEAKTTDHIRFVYLNPRKIAPPSIISFAAPVQTSAKMYDNVAITDDTHYDTAKITVHENNHFAFSIGLNGTFLNAQNFQIKGDTVSVKLGSAQKKQLSNSISLSFEYYPFGRDIDRFLPIWKDLKNFKHHLGISVGLSLSKDPLQSYYAGVDLCITKAFNIVGGVNFVNTTKSNQYQITNISSVGDLKNYVLDRSYNASFYIGISLSPSQAIKSLGL